MTIGKAELVAGMAQIGKVSHERARAMFEHLFAEIADGLAAGKTVRVDGLGTFEPVFRVPHAGRNPNTGEAIEIAGRTVVKYREAGVLRDQLNPARSVPRGMRRA